MTTKSDFTSAEWKKIVNAPQNIYRAFLAGEKTGLLSKRKEANALNDYLKKNRSSSALVKEIIADQDQAADTKSNAYAGVMRELRSVGSILARKAPGRDGDSVRAFMVKAAEAIAQAVKETPSLRSKNAISKKEQEIIGDVVTALKASPEHARARKQAMAKRAATKRAPATRRAPAAKRATTTRTTSSAASKAQQKREVEARAAARRAAKGGTTNKSSQKAAVEARAAARRQAKAKEAADSRSAQFAAKERELQRAKRSKEAREARATKAAAARAAKAAPKHTTYVVKSGDNLSAISLAVYGTANRWKEIYEANTDVLSSPNLIYPGQELKIPQ